jgi:alpha-glucosidase
MSPPDQAGVTDVTPACPWWREAVLYQIYPRSFQDSDADGNGDLSGIRMRIDYLTSLGVDAIWLGPIYPSPLRDNGYDVTDHCDVHPMFGTLAQFNGLMADCRAAGLRLMLDFVANHTSDRHPWFEASRSRSDPKRPWYLWRDPGAGGAPPNNWRSLFGGPAWSLDPLSGQFYCHSFLCSQPDLNWEHAPVREAMKEILRFWLRRGVAGFRVDAAGLIAKDPACADDPPNPEWRPGKPDAERVLHANSGSGPALADRLRELRDVLRDFPDEPVLIAETYDPPPALGRFYGRHGDGMQLAMNMGLVLSDWAAPSLAAVIAAAEAGLPRDAWPNWVMGNHDVSRVATRIGDAQARVAMVLLLTLRGTPIIYAGDELALLDAQPDGSGQDPVAAMDPAMRSRDPQRAPMPWDRTRHAGFSTARPWLPIGLKNVGRNVAAQTARAGSMLEMTRSLLWLRRREPALHRGDLRDLRHDEGTLAFSRSWRGRTLWIVLNMTASPRPWRLPGRGVLTFSTSPRAAGSFVEDQIHLAANEAMIIIIDAARE